MSTATTAFPIQREPELLGQTVVVIGASAGIGLETARRARAEGAKLILTGRNPEPLQRAASELDALSTAAFDATDPAPLERFFRDLPATIDHVMVTAGQPHYGRLLDMDFEQAGRALDGPLLLMLQVARNAAHKIRPGGTLLFMGGTGARRPAIGLGIVSTVTALHTPPSPPTSRSNSRRYESTSSPPASSTHRCRHRSSAMNSKTVAISFAPHFPSGALSDQPTSPRSLYTS
jgi:NAD(P)-dependent dehydrogenase (short-subunit alcohol dehydrogenase family)